MTPAPAVPDVIAISHIMSPIVDKLLKYWTDNNVTATHRHPNGVPVHARILPLLADLGGSRKAAGFLSPTATKCCSFCDINLEDIENLNPSSWTLRNATDVRQQAQAWFDAPTKTMKDTLEKESGVRWSPLYRLPYWDPVHHAVLGFMHNFLEGVLEHHLRVLWGIGQKASVAETLAESREEETWTDSEVAESEDELQDLLNQIEIDGSDEAEFLSSASFIDSTSTSGDSSGTAIPGAANYADFMDEDLDDDDLEDPDYYPPHATPGDVFSSEQIKMIRSGIRDVSLPTWVGRPPANLGEAKHGKLRAQDLLILFTAVFPLIIPPLWSQSANPDQDHLSLENLHHLVSALHIVSSFQTSNAEADRYQHHYTQYRSTRQILFPTFPSMPNDHLAMHNGELLRHWGPLAALSEFAGERMNGVLQRIKTNGHTDVIDFTMLCQVTRRGRLEAFLHDGKMEDLGILTLAQTLEPNFSARFSHHPKQLNSEEVATFLGNATALSENNYTLLLSHVYSEAHPWRHHMDFPHPDGSLILPPVAQHPLSFTIDNKTFSCQRSHEGNSAVQFILSNDPSHHKTGFIEKIWQVPLQSTVRTFCLVQAHKDLERFENWRTPYDDMPNFKVKVVDIASSDEQHIIEPHHIITHLSFLRQPAEHLGFQRNFF